MLQLLDEAAKGEYSLSSLKHVLGVELPETVKRFESLGHGQFWLAYGQTETMGLTSICLNRERPGCAGKPGLLVNLKIVDEFDHEVDAGKVGEILIQSPMIFHGYWGEEELTQHTFRDGWHHTGDPGRLDEDGCLWFAGRKAEKELIKPGGFFCVMENPEANNPLLEKEIKEKIHKLLLTHGYPVTLICFGIWAFGLLCYTVFLRMSVPILQGKVSKANEGQPDVETVLPVAEASAKA